MSEFLIESFQKALESGQELNNKLIEQNQKAMVREAALLDLLSRARDVIGTGNRKWASGQDRFWADKRENILLADIDAVLEGK